MGHHAVFLLMPMVLVVKLFSSSDLDKDNQFCVWPIKQFLPNVVA